MELNLESINKLLLECVKLVSATRRLLTGVGVIFPHMSALERDLRERAGEIQAYLKEDAEDAKRPLFDDETGEE